jgi:hypothetical protein
MIIKLYCPVNKFVNFEWSLFLTHSEGSPVSTSACYKMLDKVSNRRQLRKVKKKKKRFIMILGSVEVLKKNLISCVIAFPSLC